jgi:hypothetical protein
MQNVEMQNAVCLNQNPNNMKNQFHLYVATFAILFITLAALPKASGSGHITGLEVVVT